MPEIDIVNRSNPNEKLNELGFVAPFDQDLLKTMILVPFNKLIETYRTNDLKKLEILVKKDYTDKILCLPFGDRRIYYNYDLGFHLGTDYFLYEGTSVYAMAKGKIEVAGNYMEYPADWGNLLITKTENNLYILYAHIDIEKSVTDKMSVEKGQLIGRVAQAWTKNNGNWPEHLHIQISETFITYGYTYSKEDLKKFINPEILFPIKNN